MERPKPKEEIKEVLQQIIGWENNKIWTTLKGLTIAPGQLVKEYGIGQKQILNPITYYFLIFALTTYVTSITGFNAAMETESMNLVKEFDIQLSDGTIRNVERSNRFLDSEAANTLLFLPFALLLRWSIFRKCNQSFKSNSWFELFTSGHLLILNGLVSVTLWLALGNLNVLVFLNIGTLVYMIWAAKQFYNVTLKQSIFII